MLSCELPLAGMRQVRRFSQPVTGDCPPSHAVGTTVRAATRERLPFPRNPTNPSRVSR